MYCHSSHTFKVNRQNRESIYDRPPLSTMSQGYRFKTTAVVRGLLPRADYAVPRFVSNLFHS